MSKMQDIATAVSQTTGLRTDGSFGLLYGVYNGFTVDGGPNAQGQYTLVYSAALPDGRVPDQKVLRTHTKECKAVLGCNVSGRRISFPVRSAMKKEAFIENLQTALSFTTQLLASFGCKSVCERCGQSLPTEIVNVGVGRQILCQNCYNEVSQEKFEKQQQKEAKPENVIGGIVGALLGSLLGVAAIILLSQLGYISAVSGIVMGVCALKGYEILGGKLTTKGIIISVVIMLIMVYVGDRFDWAIVVAKAWEENVFDCFRAIPELIKEEVIAESDYIGNLVKLYLFCLLGAVPSVIGLVKSKQIENNVSRVG